MKKVQVKNVNVCNYPNHKKIKTLVKFNFEVKHNILKNCQKQNRYHAFFDVFHLHQNPYHLFKYTAGILSNSSFFFSRHPLHQPQLHQSSQFNLRTKRRPWYTSWSRNQKRRQKSTFLRLHRRNQANLRSTSSNTRRR